MSARLRNLVVVGAVAAAIVLAALAVRGDSGDGKATTATIPQPPLGEMASLPLAPDSARVDLATPSFADSTAISNPLFPIAEIHSSLLLGEVEGEPLRIEITLLPETKVVEWAGRPIEVLESQFVAYLDGRIHEVATDFYAQADDGSVWYFGEDVFNYENGSVADTEGTWLAGRGTPATMIMPADPQVGDVYRAENFPGVVFEQVTVKQIGTAAQGPTGPIEGAMVGEELHMEGDVEDKTFAPGYGEFFSGYRAKQNYEANALTVPADALDEPVPLELETISSSADAAFRAARSRKWQAVATAIDDLAPALAGLRKQEVPELLERQLQAAVAGLRGQALTRNAPGAAQAALAVKSAGLDVQLRYRPPLAIDFERFDLRARQLILDAAGGRAAEAAGEITTLEWIRDRLGLRGLSARDVDAQLRYLAAAAEAGELTAVERAGARLRETIRAFAPSD